MPVLPLSIAGGIATPVFPAAASASGAIGASAVGVPVAIIVVAVILLVIQLISVINESQLPGKLQEAVNNAQNQTINFRDLTDNRCGQSGDLRSICIDDAAGDLIPARQFPRLIRMIANLLSVRTAPAARSIEVRSVIKTLTAIAIRRG